MLLDENGCYEALKARDSRFDGTFFVGVKTTGIYCRCICPANTPRYQNCTFHPSAAAAEAAGFRPCLRCRPELAPGKAPVDAVERLAAIAARRIEDGALDEGNVKDLARELGVSDRQLRRAVAARFGVSPVELAQTHRLLTAKRLLTETTLPIGEVAFSSGFSSLRRFNSLFQQRYRMSPRDLRRKMPSGASHDAVCLELSYRPPLDWQGLLGFMSARCTRGVEVVEGPRYARTASVRGSSGWIAVQPSHLPNRLRLEVSASLSRAIPILLSRARRVFDLDAEPCGILEALGSLAEGRPGLRVPGAFDGFETAVRAILGQQVSVAGATTLAARFAEAFGEPIETPFAGLERLAPTACAVAGLAPEQVAAIGMPLARARTIVGLARAVDEGQLLLRPGSDPEKAAAVLRAMPGIGEWTTQYVLMRCLAWPDAFPHGDLGVRHALGTDDPKAILAIAEAWRPWRAYAAMHLWRSLEERR